MKKIFLIMTTVLLTANLFAQAPQKMSYQAVIRNASNVLITNTTVGMRLSILQGSEFGASVYVETQTPITNTNGLVSLEIGNGTVILGTFSSIDWSNGPYFIKTETDPTGGIVYSVIGTSQLMSVPYALHAKTVEIDKVNDADSSITNELQTLSITGNQLTISSGNTVTIPNKIIRGTVNGGFAPTIANGSGFTVVHTSSGTYTVTFTTPFTTTPTATVSLYNTQFMDCNAVVYSISTSDLVIKTGMGTTNSSYTYLDNLDFSFITIQ